eukprot:781478_1
MWSRLRDFSSRNRWNKFNMHLPNTSRFRRIYPITLATTVAITTTDNQGVMTDYMTSNVWSVGIAGIVSMIVAAYGAKAAYDYHNNAIAYSNDDVKFEHAWASPPHKQVTILNRGKRVLWMGIKLQNYPTVIILEFMHLDFDG